MFKVSASSLGTVNFGTLTQQVDNQFVSSLDSNKNGLIDKKEFSDAAKKQL